MKIKSFCIAMAISLCTVALFVPGTLYADKDNDVPYAEVVRKTAGMVSDRQARAIAAKYGLNILNVTWEDTGRYLGSSVGPNISDMTIQVQQKDQASGRFYLTSMPVIRQPNFSDVTADIDPKKFYLLVGNEKGKALKRISLEQLLADPRAYMTEPGSWKGSEKSLLAKRDTHVLVSAQACFLPVPRKGIAEFNPVIFNYQSYEGDPAVLTILATREGTSMTVIDNKRDAFQAGMTWGQRLFFNQKGDRAPLTGKRLSDYLAGDDTKGGKDKKVTQSVEAAQETGLNMVLLIQVPLKQKNLKRHYYMENTTTYMKSSVALEKRSNVEEAVIGHGKVEGPFTEIGGLEIERDEKFPVRVTVQFYKATSNGIVSEQDIKAIADQIQLVYKQADYVGSLVTQGSTGRPTEYEGPKFEPPDWWEQFWKRHQSNTALTPEETIKMLRELYGHNWKPRSEEEFGNDLIKLEENRVGSKK